MTAIGDMEASQVVAHLRSHMNEMREGLVRMTRNRFLWRAVDDALHERAGDTSSTWLMHYRDIYVEAQIIGLRRIIQGDNQKEHLTLSRVLGTLQNRPDIINTHHLDSLADVISPAVRAHMEAEWLVKDGHFDRAIPAKDRESLTSSEAARKVLRWGNRQVAHTYPIEPIRTVAPPLFADLHALLDTVTDVYSRYHQLLAGTYLAEGLNIYPSNWTNSFDRPLFDHSG